MSDVKTFDPEVEHRIDSFTDKFNTFIQQQKTEIIKSKEAYTSQLSQLQNEYKELLRSLEGLSNKEKELNELVSNEYQDANISNKRIEELKLKESQLLEERNSLSKTVKELNDRVFAKRQELEKIKHNQSRQSETTLPESLLYEQLLGFKIEGLRDDLLKFIFKNIDPQNIDKLFSFNLDVSEHSYKVDNVQPEIPSDELIRILEEFNESRNLTNFLKAMRNAFKKTL